MFKNARLGRMLGLTLAVVALATTALLVTAEDSKAGAIINNGVVQLGVRDYGALNEPGGTPSSGTSTTWVGIRYMPLNTDATAPGCQCEGWGAAYNMATSGWCNVSSGGCPGGTIALTSFTSSASSAMSVVQIGNLKVTHDYKPSAITSAVYDVDVTFENTGPTTLTNVLYRRAMDWDIEPTAFSEYSTIDGVTPVPTTLVYFSNNGFANSNPLVGAGSMGCLVSVYFIDCGPNDHGAVFDFNFGDLAPGGTRTLKTHYGATANEADALSAIAAVGMEVWTLGQCNMSSNPSCSHTTGTPNTFIWGFSNILPAPKADFDWMPKPQCHNFPTTFSDTTTHPGGVAITKSIWTLGDGSPATTYMPAVSSVTHTYTRPGSYIVTLNVTDAKGKMHEVSKIVSVVNCAPSIDPIVDWEVFELDKITFTVSGSDINGDDIKFYWNPATLPSSAVFKDQLFTWQPARGYAGTYGPIHFWVEDPYGAQAHENMTIVVKPLPDPPVPKPGDADGDGIKDEFDNCPDIANPDQKDTNGDGIGDACSGELPSTGGDGGDGGDDATDDVASLNDGVKQADFDKDGLPDGMDNCPYIPNVDQRDQDRDGLGDVCDPDLDGDGIDQLDAEGRMRDNCPYTFNPGQEDLDGDGIGDLCQGDVDADGVPDALDNCVWVRNPGQEDSDGDGIGDACTGLVRLGGPVSGLGAGGSSGVSNGEPKVSSTSTAGLPTWAIGAMAGAALLVVAGVLAVVLLRRRESAE
jgi:PKD repeat protein